MSFVGNMYASLTGKFQEILNIFLFWYLKLFVKDTGPSLWYAISNIKTQEMLISSGFKYISDFMIGFIIYELTG